MGAFARFSRMPVKPPIDMRMFYPNLLGHNTETQATNLSPEILYSIRNVRE
jgi:hypothetical protein